MKLATEVTFIFNNKFCRQIDGCTMGGPLSVTLSDIYMSKMEIEVVVPLKPKFYRRYVDDIYNRRNKNEFDQVFHALNNYHHNIKLTIEISPTKFLDTKLINSEGKYITKVHRKQAKLPIHWSSKVPKRYKRNTITIDLHRAENISSNMNEEIKIIRNKFIKADYPNPFINSVINQYKNKSNRETQELDDNDDFIIPPYLFETEKQFILLKLPFCELNEQKSKDFIKKFNKFTNDSFRLAISWNTRKLKSLFKLKDKNLYPSCVVYYGECYCGANYVGETFRNTTTRWSEHNNPNHKSDPADHIKRNIDHIFQWKIICSAPVERHLRKNLEAIYISLYKPSLNNQKSFERLILFKNGIT